MKNRRRVVPGALHHVYTISRDGGVLFYRVSDRLCLFTVLSVYSRKYKVAVLGLSIMFTHIHLMVRVVDLAQLRAFIGQTLATFTRIINADRRKRGELFRRPFGSAPRVSPKEKRSSLIYLFNNPVEKHLCAKAVDDRWSFLAYSKTPFPFSKPLIKREVSFRLRRAAECVDAECAAGRYLRPAFLRRLFGGLVKEEQESLTDYIINKYQFICFDDAIGLFGDVDRMLLAAEASAGKEFDVGEQFEPLSDVAYREMAAQAAKNHLFEDWKLLHLSDEEIGRWMRYFRVATTANDRQIRRFMHLDQGVRD